VDDTKMVQMIKSMAKIHQHAHADPQVPECVTDPGCKDCTCITLDEVYAAQNAWGDALVSISTTYDTEGLDAATSLAEEIIDSAYGYNLGPVLFKPTLTYGNQSQSFRPTAEGALSYFVGGNPAFPQDTGFALKGWTSVEFDNKAIFLDCDIAISMGNVHITDKDGSVTTVDKTFAYKKDEDGNLRIILHHSSIPNDVRDDVAPWWGQCGGKNWKNATICAHGSSCVVQNEWYSQCIPEPVNTHAQVPGYVSNSSCNGECDCITLEEVYAAQKTWGHALVSISQTYETSGLEAATELAGAIIDAAYGYNWGCVLFKPTLTTGNQSQAFRTTREGALSYFVGGNPDFPDDTGFALKGWTKVEFENNAIFLDCNMAFSMGFVHITNKDGSVTTVDKTFGYRKDEDGNLRIILHHSAGPNEVATVG